MPTSGTEKVPEEAARAMARFRHDGIVRRMNPDAPSTFDRLPDETQRDLVGSAAIELQAAYPAIRQSVLSEVKEGLLGEEALEAVARVCHGGPQESFDYVDGEDREFALEGARRIAEAALATITPEEEK